MIKVDGNNPLSLQYLVTVGLTKFDRKLSQTDLCHKWPIFGVSSIEIICKLSNWDFMTYSVNLIFNVCFIDIAYCSVWTEITQF